MKIYAFEKPISGELTHPVVLVVSSTTTLPSPAPPLLRAVLKRRIMYEPDGFPFPISPNHSRASHMHN